MINYAMIGAPTVGFRMEIGIYVKGVVDAVNKFRPPHYPPPAGNTLDATQIKV